MKINIFRRNLIFIFLVLAVFLLASCTQSNNVSDSTAAKKVSNNKGSPAPDFEATLASDGSKIKLSDYKNNKPVIVYFWATWCPECKKDLSVVRDVYPNYKDSVEFIAMDLDIEEDAEIIKNYAKEMKLGDIKFALTDTNVLKDYSVLSTTTKYAVGRDGIIIWKGSGATNSKTWDIIFKGLQSS